MKLSVEDGTKHIDFRYLGLFLFRYLSSSIYSEFFLVSTLRLSALSFKHHLSDKVLDLFGTCKPANEPSAAFTEAEEPSS